MKKGKFETLTHKGPLFPKPYSYKNLKLKVDGVEISLNLKQEEMAWAWAAKLETPYVEDKVFQKNFWNDFKKLFSSEIQKSKFPSSWDFSSIRKVILETREANKQKTKTEKEAEKAERETLKAIYGKAVLNGIEVDLGNYIIEPAGIFMGRGNHPKRGSFKTQAGPEDVTINTTDFKNAPTPPEGTKWKAVLTNGGALWTASWYENVTGAQKKISFGATSFVKQDSDIKKFAKAAELARNFDKVNDHIDKGVVHSSTHIRKVATVCKLISVMSIRVGDERDATEQAETFGATTLRVNHIKINNTEVEFDFLGKDSVRYHNVVKFDINTVRNIKEFCENKSKEENVFEGITSKDVSEFLGSSIEGLSAKQFRTAWGSTLLAEELRKTVIEPHWKEGKKIEKFLDANLTVAIKLNHQNAVSESYDKSIETMKNTLKITKEANKLEKTEIEKSLESLKEEKKIAQDVYKKRKTGSELKEALAIVEERFKAKEEKLKNKLLKLKDRVESLESKIKMKEKTRGVALGTSKQNYSSPEIAASWCKDHNVNLDRILPKTLQKKFAWALDADKDFYKKYPHV